jgi:hypothetical protein
MVSTRQATKAHRAEEGSSLADSGDEYEERTPEPNKTGGTKRARTTKTTVDDKRQEQRRKKAKLSMLPEMPVDILYDVSGSLLFHDLVDTKRFPDIFSRPPEGFATHFLDGEDSQRIPHQQVIAARLAGLIPDGPGM